MICWIKHRVNGKPVREDLGCKVENLVGLGPENRLVTDEQIQRWDEKQDTNGASGSNTVTFTQAENRDNIKSNETQETLFGKIQKWFADLQDAAFCKVADNLTTVKDGYVLSAKQGKNLKELYEEAMNGCKLTMEGENFFIEKGAVKKKLGSTIVKLGTGTRYDLTSYPDYKSFTKDNFLLNLTGVSGGGGYSGYVGGQHSISKGGNASAVPVINYNAETGILTVSGLSNSFSRHTEGSGDGWSYNGTESGNCAASVEVYLVY